jgi:hypothetical protein
MARELTPLKVKIGLKTNGHALYPSFNDLPVVQASGMDWALYIESDGAGWHYDRISGHKDDTLDSPIGQQWGMLLVPKDFADEAIAIFPDECSIMTALECQDFYDNKAHIKEPDEYFDNEILSGIKMKQDLALELTAEQVKALDPDDDTPGIRKNKGKTWALYSVTNNITLPK